LRATIALVADLGDEAAWRYVEFFTANIRNPNTRRAYLRACNRFLGWCEDRGLALAAIIASDKVEGAAVYNRQGERLGTVDNFMVDKSTGQVAYAVMSFGGFLGMGESYHPLPWRVLNYDTRQGGFVSDLDRSRLEKAPSYMASDVPNWSDRT
jgi:hypothetical protein